MRVGEPETDSEPCSFQDSYSSYFTKSEALQLLWKPRTKPAFSAGRRNAQGQLLVTAGPLSGRHGDLPPRDWPVAPNRGKRGEKGGKMSKWRPLSPAWCTPAAGRFSGISLAPAGSAAHPMPAGKHSDKRGVVETTYMESRCPGGHSWRLDSISRSSPWRWTS
jgi:hypothetical protein